MRTHPRLLVLSFTALFLFAGCSTFDPDAQRSRPIALFNGRNLDGWRHVLADAAVAPERVWSVRNGVLVCQGTPLGYLYSGHIFNDFRLVVEYRWPAGSKPGNSGLFSRVHGPVRALPACAEVQLLHGSAGDVMTLQGMRMATNQARYFHVAKHEVAGDVDGVRKTVDAENPPGEWNRVELLVRGGDYTVWLNGRLVNEATGIEVMPGPIGLQSEGGVIEFRRVEATPLP